MSFFVVDTNVPIVANKKSPQANPDCVLACIDVLEEIYTHGTLLLDDLGLIFDEYKEHLNFSGQPGLGDAFMRWARDNRGQEHLCRLIPITPLPEDDQDFEQFPERLRASGFDRSDRKFVAVALASGCQPAILNAVDTDWAEHFAALSASGVHIKFLCPQHVCPQIEA